MNPLHHESRVLQTTSWGDVVLDDISTDFYLDLATEGSRPFSVSVDLETDPCDFDDPLFFQSSHTRIITIKSEGSGRTEIVRVEEKSKPHRLRVLLGSEHVTTFFHHAFFDMTFLLKDFGITVKNPRCTYILARVVKGWNKSDVDCKTGLKYMLDYFGFSPMEESMALSDWSGTTLTSDQIRYAVKDVDHLVALYDHLEDLAWVSSAQFAIEHRPIIQSLEEGLRQLVALRVQGVVGIYGHVY